MRNGRYRIMCLVLNIISWGYLALLFGWLLAYLVVGDRNGYVGLASMVAVLLFIPLPVVLVTALVCQSRWLGAGFGLGLLVFLLFWGGLFVPGIRTAQAGAAQAGEPELVVMTYNVLAWHTMADPLVEVILAENADVVLIQELNNHFARVLAQELIDEYPYQNLQPADNPTGIGTISKFPIRKVDESFPVPWIGGPQVMELDWNGQTATLVNIHMYSTTGIYAEPVVRRTFQIREEEARLLVELAKRSGPLIMGGDANSTSLSQSYKIITSELNDAWKKTGFGLGHTFPGPSTLPGSDRVQIGSWYVPPFLARIDYVFYSDHWRAVSARLAKVDGVSDHRGLVAVLQRSAP